jgi:hypothetical protein
LRRIKTVVAAAAGSAPTPLTTRISFSPAVNAERVTASAACRAAAGSAATARVLWP